MKIPLSIHKIVVILAVLLSCSFSFTQSSYTDDKQVQDLIENIKTNFRIEEVDIYRTKDKETGEYYFHIELYSNENQRITHDTDSLAFILRQIGKRLYQAFKPHKKDNLITVHALTISEYDGIRTYYFFETMYIDSLEAYEVFPDSILRLFPKGISKYKQPSHINGNIVCIWKGKQLASDSKCPLKVKSNRGKNWNLLNENWEDNIANGDSVQVFGEIDEHEFVSTWFDANSFIESTVTITYQDSIPKDSLPLSVHSDGPFRKVVVEFVYHNRKGLDRYEYYWKGTSKFQFGVEYSNAQGDD